MRHQRDATKGGDIVFARVVKAAVAEAEVDGQRQALAFAAQVEDFGADHIDAFVGVIGVAPARHVFNAHGDGRGGIQVAVQLEVEVAVIAKAFAQADDVDGGLQADGIVGVAEAGHEAHGAVVVIGGGLGQRGATDAEDRAMEAELLADPKEIAEHLMLIDLGRNDAGRVSETGTVKLTDKMIVERYSHVMHIVSNVTGRLKDNTSCLDVLRATLPAGTLSGAPKIRAMEIIDELEPVKRGVYGGAVGYLSFNGNMDTAIAIRTAVIKDNTLHIQAGAGVVADSVPRLEWKETMNKGRAIFRAVAMTYNDFDH